MVKKEKGHQESDYLEVRSLLIECAETRTTLDYGEIARRLGRKPGNAFSHWIGGLLEELNQDEHDLGRPLLGALAVNTQTGVPQPGLFPFGQEAGGLRGRPQVRRECFLGRGNDAGVQPLEKVIQIGVTRA